MISSITRLVLGYAIKFTIMNVQLDYSFQHSVQFFSIILNYYNVL